MPAPANCEQFIECVQKSGLIDEAGLKRFRATIGTTSPAPATPAELASAMVDRGVLTRFQASQLKEGHTRGFMIGGKYKLLEFLGAGGMGHVYLCEHTAMRRWVALKILPAELGKDSSYMERFYREARAVARLDHTNIVRAYDVDHAGNVHFLVMEYVDGTSLQQLVERHGPLDPARAAHYVSQAAWGLQHAHELGLVHRDVKPANLLLDRQGTIKLLDLGLARFFHEDDGLSKKYDETVIGTTDYLSPEQVIDGKVDIRADIYGLGATFYFLLTGQTLFGAGKTAAKLVWQQVRKPKPIRSRRPEVPAELAELIEEKMLAKNPRDRFQTPAEVCEALAPWTLEAIAPPEPSEMPQLCPALRQDAASGVSGAGPTPSPSIRIAAPSPASRVAPASNSGRSQASIDTRISRTPASNAATANGSAVKTPKRGEGSGRQRKAEQPATPEAPARARPSRGRYLTLLAGMLAATACVLVLSVLVVWWAVASLRTGSLAGIPAGGQDGPPASSPQGRPAEPAALPPVAGVNVTAAPDGHRVRTASYEAHVGVDGNLASLRVGGAEFLKTGVRFGASVSRGSYFYYTQDANPGVVQLTAIERPSANVIKAVGDRFTVVYEFGADSIAMKLTNATDHRVPFYIVFDPAVSAVLNEQGDLARPPVQRDWPTTTWFAGKARLGITGGTKIWGPWMQGFQVWEASLATYETRQVTLTAGAASNAETTRIATAAAGGEIQRIEMPNYDAVVEADGCLTSLRVQGVVELLRPGADISRGLYLHDGKRVVACPEVEQPDKNVITARSNDASIRYEFAADEVACTVTNKMAAPLVCFIVFDPAIVAMRDGNGEWNKLPVARPSGAEEPRYATTTWFAAGHASLKITGGSQVWGPWAAQKLSVWEASLKPKETRRIVLSPGASITTDENARIVALTGKEPKRPAIVLTGPTDFQVFQRNSRLEGEIRVRGVAGPLGQLQARLSGASLQGPLPDRWQTIQRGPGARFEQALKTPAGGWYRLELRAIDGEKVIGAATVEHVGVGEVFIAAGQSNSTNCSPDRLDQTSGSVATFDGYHWRLGDDPQPGVHDNTAGGSFFPAFGDALATRYRVPIGIASTGHSGTSVNQWQPGGELFHWTMTRANQLGPHGFRGLLWHQGESDVGMSADEYATRLTNVIRGSQRSAGWEFPWFVARVSYHNPQNVSFATTRDGQKKLWDAGVAQEGPDTDMLTGDNRSENGQGIHFSAKGNRAHGRLWADKVGVYLDRVLEK